MRPSSRGTPNPPALQAPSVRLLAAILAALLSDLPILPVTPGVAAPPASSPGRDAAAPADPEADPVGLLQHMGARGFGDLTADYLAHLQRTNRLPADVRLLRLLRLLAAADDDGAVLAYLDVMRQRPDVPPELARTFDYEHAATLLRQSQKVDPDTGRQLAERGRSLLRAFVERHGSAPEAVEARNELAGQSLDRVRRLTAQADTVKDPKTADALRKEARALIDETRGLLIAAADLYDHLPPPVVVVDATTRPRPPRGRAGAGAGRPANRVLPDADDPSAREAARLAIQLNLGLAAFHAAHCFPAADSHRQEELTRALELFVDVFQRHRTGAGMTAAYAHYWTGRIYLEQGDARLALDVFEEVLAAEPPLAVKVSAPARALFGETYIQVYESFLRLGPADRVLNDSAYGAKFWLRDHLAEKGLPHYAGVQFAALKAELAAADAMKDKDPWQHRSLVQAALDKLHREVIKPNTGYAAEALAVRDRYADVGRLPPANPGDSFQKAAAAAEALAGQGRWADAAEAWPAALRLADGKTPPDDLEHAKFAHVAALANAGRSADALAQVQELVGSQPKGRYAVPLAFVAVRCRYDLFLQATSNAAATQAADEVIAEARRLETAHADLDQADDARRLRGLTLAALRRDDEAAAAFDAVKQASPAYADSQLRAARSRWHAVLARMSPAATPADFGREPAAGQVAKARGNLAACFARLAKEPDADALAPAAVAAKTLAAEMAGRIDGPAAALASAEPLAKAIRDAGRPALDAASARLDLLCFDAALALRDYAKADALLDRALGSQSLDPAALTAAIIEVGRGLAERASVADDDAARAALAAFLGRVEGRRLPYVARLWVAEKQFDLGRFEAAATSFDLLASASPDGAAWADAPTDPATRAAERLRVVNRRAASLRKQADDPKTPPEARRRLRSQALAAIDGALAERAQASPGKFPLADRMERGRTLAALATGGDTGSRQAAYAEFAAIAKALERLRPAEYFEAQRLAAESALLAGRPEAARQIVRRTLALYPSCGGPIERAAYDALSARLGNRPSTP